MIPALSHNLSSSRRSPLCPVCGSSRIRISTSVSVQYDVIYEALNHDFRVVDEMLGDAMWDADSGASCLLCAWRGTVADLRTAGPAVN